jgi:hypothetical protein
MEGREGNGGIEVESCVNGWLIQLLGCFSSISINTVREKYVSDMVSLFFTDHLWGREKEKSEG